MLNKILGFLLVYKYIVLFAVQFASSFGVPLPAAPTQIAAAAFASQKYFNIYFVLLSGLAGSIAGDFLLFYLVRRFGRPVLKLIGLKKFSNTKTLEQAEASLGNYRGLVVIASRFQLQATTVVNIIAGLGKIDFRLFATYVIIGEFLQVLFYSAIGFIFAESWQSVYGAIGKFSWIIVLATAIVATIAGSKILKRIFK